MRTSRDDRVTKEEGLEVLQSIKTAAELLASCARLYMELAMSVMDLVPSAIRREHVVDELVLAAES
jgi:hypothetical protein